MKLTVLFTLLLGQSLLVIPSFAASETPASLVRRISVFPFVAPGSLAKEADDAWWKLREELTKNRRFLVASRHFLNKKEVLQPRDQLAPGDVLVLARLLEAQSLITVSVTNERVSFSAYEGETGWPLWEQALLFDQDIPLREQVVPLVARLARGFIASFPYQGFHLREPEEGLLLTSVGQSWLAEVYVGRGHQLQPGSEVQWIRLQRTGLGELFREAGRFTVVTAGRVIRLGEEKVIVEWSGEGEPPEFREYDLVHFPSEFARMASEQEVSKDPSELLLREVQGPSVTTEEKEEKGGALVTALTFIGTALLYLLLAF